MRQRTSRHTFWTRIIPVLGAALFSANQAEAQWGGGYGGFGGYGAFWGTGVGRYGMSLSQLNFYRMQAAAENASRYNLNNAMAAQAYQAANLYRQSAIDEMFNTRIKAQQYAQSKYSGVPYGGGFGYGGRAPVQLRPRMSVPGVGQATVDQAAQPPAAFEEMITSDGEVFWPLGAPNQGDLGNKQAVATAAIQSVIQQSQAGPVAVRRVVHARNALADYAVPAALALKKDRPDDVDDFAAYVKTLDAGLRSLAMGQTAGRPGSPTRTTKAPDIEPPNSPESAGEVLKRKIERKSDAPPRER